MELHAIYPDDIPGDLRDYAANHITPGRGEEHDRVKISAMVEFYELLATLPGPAKWVRLNHYQQLSFFALDQREHPRQHSQVMIHFHVAGPKHTIATVEYLLPFEQRPWQYATTTAYSMSDAIKFVADGLARCESRHEHLIE